MFNFLKSKKSNDLDTQFKEEAEKVIQSYKRLLKTYKDNEKLFWDSYFEEFADEIDAHIEARR